MYCLVGHVWIFCDLSIKIIFDERRVSVLSRTPRRFSCDPSKANHSIQLSIDLSSLTQFGWTSFFYSWFFSWLVSSFDLGTWRTSNSLLPDAKRKSEWGEERWRTRGAWVQHQYVMAYSQAIIFFQLSFLNQSYRLLMILEQVSHEPKEHLLKALSITEPSSSIVL